MKVLILKPSSLGDVVQALPVLRLIRLHYPAAQVYWVIDSRLSTMLEGDPDLAGIVPFHRKGWATGGYWVRFYSTVRWARAQRFDWVIDLQSLARTGAFAWLVNGRQLIGLDEVREGARGFYDRVVRRPSFHTHAVDWYLEVLHALGVPVHRDFEWLPERPESSAVVRKTAGEGHEWLAMVPGARWLNKRWPAEHFCTFARQILAGNPSVKIVVLGGKEDQPLGKQIVEGAGAARVLDMTGRSSLPEMVEWIRLSSGVISNDTGPMHVAAALGKPVLPFFGPTEPRRTGPYGQQRHALQLDLDCTPCMSARCHHRPEFECLRALTPSMALGALRSRAVLQA